MLVLLAIKIFTLDMSAGGQRRARSSFVITQHENLMSVRTTHKLDFLLHAKPCSKDSFSDLSGKQKLLH